MKDKKKSQYNAKEVEKKWKEYWEKEKVFKFDLKRKGKIFSIDTPPPTVSGKMHIGHAFQYSQQDFMARFWRMKENVFCPFGTDDNGLPTERLIEKVKKVKSKEMSRADFIKLCLKTLKEITPDFINDWKLLGISADYDLYYSTIDDNSRKLSQKSFIDLYKQGRIYKKEFPTIWCPECQTAIAQAELEDKEQNTVFSTLKFKVEKKDLLVATTRPELLPACVAVFVNPKDKRYKKLVGKKAKVPLFNFQVPILEDESAQIDKGTGVLMVCSYGDKYDAEAINKHKLTPKLVLEKDGRLNYQKYKGMKIKEARKQVSQELEEKGLVKGKEEIVHAVNVHDKCGTEIEFITTEQWFIKILDLKKRLIEQGKKVNWHPEFMFKRYKNWVEGLEWDWSISRDRHFGVAMPVWNCECGEIIVADEKELPIDPLQVKKICKKCKKEAIPESKVLDTWATSSITPQITSSLIDNKVVIPYRVRNNAHDIIRTWDFYTITKSYLHEKKIPWKNMMVSGFVTLDKEKMSKSKGNVISPQEVLEKYGADALRFWAAGSKLGEDLNYQEKDIVTGKKFVNKLFNASKFVFMNLGEYNGKQGKPTKAQRLEKINELFLIKLNKLMRNCTKYFENYEYSRAKSEIENFFYKTFTDNYLEIIKKRIYNETYEQNIGTYYTLYHSLLAVLKLIAPIMPFITEEIYQKYFRKDLEAKSIHLTDWPKEIGGLFFKEKDSVDLDLFIKILSKIRQEKTKKQKSMNAECVLALPKEDVKKLGEMIEDLKDVTNSKEIREGKFKVEFV